MDYYKIQLIDQLNRFLKEYFELVNTSQFELDLWQGTSVIKNLIFRSTALENLDLPFEVLAGEIGTVSIKVPWSSILTSSIEVSIEDVVVLFVPSSAKKYSQSEAEAKAEFVKWKEIERFENSLRQCQQLGLRGLLKLKTKYNLPLSRFIRKQTLKVLQNARIKIKNVHLRYEDSGSWIRHAFAAGICLESLEVKGFGLDENVGASQGFASQGNLKKVVDVNDLSVYWNSQADLIQNLTHIQTEMIEFLKDFVSSPYATKTYVLHPLSVTTAVVVALDPIVQKSLFSHPKLEVVAGVENISIGFTNEMLKDVIGLVDHLICCQNALKYKNYRPNLRTYRGYYNDWWKFAYNCILGEHVQKRQNWRWSKILRHRRMCKRYFNALYFEHTNIMIGLEVGLPDFFEEFLDAFNIILVRKQVYLRLQEEGYGSFKRKYNPKSGWFPWIRKEIHNEPRNKPEIFPPPEHDRELPNCQNQSIRHHLELQIGLFTITYGECIELEANSKNIYTFEIDNFKTDISFQSGRLGAKGLLLADSVELLRFETKEDSSVSLLRTAPGERDFSSVCVEIDINCNDSGSSKSIIVRVQNPELCHDIDTIVRVMSIADNLKEPFVSFINSLFASSGKLDLKIELVAPRYLVGCPLKSEPSILAIDFENILVKVERQNLWEERRRVRQGSMDEAGQGLTEAMTRFAYEKTTVQIASLQIMLLPGKIYLTPRRPMRSPPLVKCAKFSCCFWRSRLNFKVQLPHFRIKATLAQWKFDAAESEIIDLVKFVRMFSDHRPNLPSISSVAQNSALNELRFEVNVHVDIIVFQLSEYLNGRKKPLMSLSMNSLGINVEKTMIQTTEVVDVDALCFTSSTGEHSNSESLQKHFDIKNIHFNLSHASYDQHQHKFEFTIFVELVALRICGKCLFSIFFLLNLYKKLIEEYNVNREYLYASRTRNETIVGHNSVCGLHGMENSENRSPFRTIESFRTCSICDNFPTFLSINIIDTKVLLEKYFDSLNIVKTIEDVVIVDTRPNNVIQRNVLKRKIIRIEGLNTILPVVTLECKFGKNDILNMISGGSIKKIVEGQGVFCNVFFPLFDNVKSPISLELDRTLLEDTPRMNFYVRPLSILLELDYLNHVSDVLNGISKYTMTIRGPPFNSGCDEAVSNQSPIAAPNQEVNESFNFKGTYSLWPSEIILIKELNQADNKAFIFYGDVDVNHRPQAENNLNGTSKVRIYLCLINSEEETQYLTMILKPTTFTFENKRTASNDIQTDIYVSDAIIIVNPAAVDLLIKLCNSTTRRSSITAESISEDKDYSNLWEPKRIGSEKFWFLQREFGPNANYVVESRAEESKKVRLKVGNIVFNFDAEIENYSLPLIMVETSADVRISSGVNYMTLTGETTLSAAYYNHDFSMWEFLIEPAKPGERKKEPHSPCKLNFDYKMELYKNSITNDCQLSSVFTLQSRETIELTVSSTALNAIEKISEGFSVAHCSNKNVPQFGASSYPYLVGNHTGIDLNIWIKEAGIPQVFTVEGSDFLEHETVSTVKLNTNQSVSLGHFTRKEQQDFSDKPSILKEQDATVDRFLSVEIPEVGFKNCIPVNRSVSRYYTLSNGEGLICDVEVKGCQKTVLLRGLLQIKNELEVPVYVSNSPQKGPGKWGFFILPNTCGNLPLSCLFSKNRDIFIAPDGYLYNNEPYKLDDILGDAESIKYFACYNRWNLELDRFHFMVEGKAQPTLFEQSNRKSLANPSLTIHLKPFLLFMNLLPVPIEYHVYGSDPGYKLAGQGSTNHITNADRSRLWFTIDFKIPDYRNQTWTAGMCFDFGKDGISNFRFKSEENEETIFLGVLHEIKDNQLLIQIFSSFWIINRTGMAIDLKGNESCRIDNSTCSVKPQMFTYPGKIFTRRSCKLKVLDSEWSEEIVISATGRRTFVTCKSASRECQVGVEIKASGWGLTNHVIFTPRFYLINEFPYDIHVIEVEGTNPGIKIPRGKCIPFWPQSKVPHLKVVLKLLTIERTIETKPFQYDKADHILLPILNWFGGLYVDITVTEIKTSILFGEYAPGQAPVLLINDSRLVIEYSQCDSDSISKVLPGTCKLYTWENPLKPRVLNWWNWKRGKRQTDLLKDQTGVLKFEGVPQLYWVTFLDGAQRVLLFSNQAKIFGILRKFDEEIPLSEFRIAIRGMGLSLVNNQILEEIMYMRVASSQEAWETNEDAHKLSGLAIRETEGFDEAITSSHSARSQSSKAENGLWLSFKQFPSSFQIHAKLDYIQIDNQLRDSVFPVVFVPIRPPKTVKQTEPKPFIEINLTKINSAHLSVNWYKYCKVEVQEFLINIEIDFIVAIVEFFFRKKMTPERRRKKFLKEYNLVCTTFQDILANESDHQACKHFYEYFHVSPLSMRVGFSSYGVKAQCNTNAWVLQLIFRSIEFRVFTSIQDAVLKVGCFEISSSYLSADQLTSMLASQYMWRIPTLILGILFGGDILGNPFGVAVGVASGARDFFNEPYQGALQGPGKFVEGLSLGTKSLLSATISGTTGGVSKVIGTLGNAAAYVTMDPSFCSRRQQKQQIKTSSSEVFARSTRELLMGFFEGFTGIVTRPIRGARDDGLAGFGRGVVIGACGIIARPVTGILDFASGSFEAIKLATSIVQEVKRTRLRRCIPSDRILKPYFYHEVEGVELLRIVERGIYARTEDYVVSHSMTQNGANHVLVATNKRVIYAKSNIFGTWTILWKHSLEEILKPPVTNLKTIYFYVKSIKKKGSSSASVITELSVPTSSEIVAEWLVWKIEEAIQSEDAVQGSSQVTQRK